MAKDLLPGKIPLKSLLQVLFWGCFSCFRWGICGVFLWEEGCCAWFCLILLFWGFILFVWGFFECVWFLRRSSKLTSCIVCMLE